MTAPKPMQPMLHGARIVLRPFAAQDAPAVQALAGAREVAATTLTIPHPYGDGIAEAWIESHGPAYAAGTLASFAVVELSTRQLAGAIGLSMKPAHGRGEIGYWIGVPSWNRGYATEAGALVLRFAFQEMGLNRVYAQHFPGNPASGRVLQKLGMTYEGRLRQHVRRWGIFEDLEQYGILADEWRRMQPGDPATPS
jgi:ribosomal-protein-alanine N-acetyltransferase